MDVLDLLDLEAERFVRDYRHCAAAPGVARHRGARDLLQRIAALLLATDQAMLPTLVILEPALFADLMLAHGSLKAQLAVALSSSLEDELRGWSALLRTRRALYNCRDVIEGRLRPALLQAMTPGERHMVGEQVARWLEHNRRQQAQSPTRPPGLAGSRASAVKPRRPRRAPSLGAAVAGGEQEAVRNA